MHLLDLTGLHGGESGQLWGFLFGHFILSFNAAYFFECGRSGTQLDRVNRCELFNLLSTLLGIAHDLNLNCTVSAAAVATENGIWILLVGARLGDTNLNLLLNLNLDWFRIHIKGHLRVHWLNRLPVKLIVFFDYFHT